MKRQGGVEGFTAGGSGTRLNGSNLFEHEGSM